MNKDRKKVFIISFIVALLVVILYIWRVFHMPSSSMQPTIPKDSKFISQRYVFSSPQRGEVVIFTAENLTYGSKGLVGEYYIKRLIGLPGDMVEIKDGQLFINGDLYDSKIYYTLPLAHETQHINSEKPFIIIPENHYFVLGDNSEMSLDGRYFGPIPTRNVWGRMIYLMSN